MSKFTDDLKKLAGDDMKTIKDTLEEVVDIEQALSGNIPAAIKAVAVDTPKVAGDVIDDIEDTAELIHEALPSKKHEECHYYDTAEECEKKIEKGN